jgi:hypothetical protein
MRPYVVFKSSWTSSLQAIGIHIGKPYQIMVIGYIEYRKYSMAYILMASSSILLWRVLIAYVFSDYSGTVN